MFPEGNRSLPAQGGLFQSFFYIHVITAVVYDDDIEIGVLSNPKELFHVKNELFYPAGLIFHWSREEGKEENQSKISIKIGPSCPKYKIRHKA